MTRCLLFLALLLAEQAASAQPAATGAIETARSYSFWSSILHEQRPFDVALPKGYERQTTERYPVLFVLDGEFEGQIATAITGFYTDMSMLPSVIVVAIHNVNRMRDMTPAPLAGFQAPPGPSGGADAFLEFLSDELIPYVDKTYRTAPMRVLVGHSIGGLFAMHVLASHPALFTGYLLMEPAAWWNDEQPHRAVEAMLTRPGARRARVILVNARQLNVDTTSWGGTRPMVRQLHVTGETHASMAAAGMLVGLRTLFADFRPTTWQPGSHPIAMLDRYDSLSARVGYSPPIPMDAFSKAFDMSIQSRWFDDAQVILDKLTRSQGESNQTGAMRDRLARAKAQPEPPGFLQLVISTHRPAPAEVSRFLGHWEAVDASRPHTVDVRAAGDTIIVHDHIPFPGDEPFDADDPVVQITSDGSLEWGLPFFRGIAALLVLHATIQSDGTMSVTRSVRGWVPVGPGPDLTVVEHFRRQ